MSQLEDSEEIIGDPEEAGLTSLPAERESEDEGESERKLPLSNLLTLLRRLSPSDVFAALDKDYYGSGDDSDDAQDDVLGAAGYARLVNSSLDECLQGDITESDLNEAREVLEKHKDALQQRIAKRLLRWLAVCIIVASAVMAVLLASCSSMPFSRFVDRHGIDLMLACVAAALLAFRLILSLFGGELNQVNSLFDYACSVLEMHSRGGEDTASQDADKTE